MYVNPFERMRKKREDDQKQKVEVEKEREKYARLSAQMGFTQDKGVMPSFIKSLIGEKNQNAVPPFGPGMTPMPPSEASTPAPSQSQSYPNFNTAPAPNFNQSQPLTPRFENQPPAFAQPVNFNPEPKQWQDPNLMPPVNFNPQPPIVSPQNSIGENYQQQRIPPLGGIEPMRSPLNNTSFNQGPPKLDFKSPLSAPEPVVPSEIKITRPEPIQHEQMTYKNFAEALNTNTLTGQVYAIVANSDENMLKELLNLLPTGQQIQIDAQEVYQYTAPDLFLLKKAINLLPLLSLDDKRVLWEKTSICLAATEYGKTDSEFDQIVEEIGITDPIGLIAEEFNTALGAYGLDKIAVPVIIENFDKLELSEITPILQFIYEVFVSIPTLKFIIQISSEILQEAKKFEIVNQVLMKISSFISDKPILIMTESVKEPEQGYFEIPGEDNFETELDSLTQFVQPQVAQPIPSQEVFPRSFESPSDLNQVTFARPSRPELSGITQSSPLPDFASQQEMLVPIRQPNMNQNLNQFEKPMPFTSPPVQPTMGFQPGQSMPAIHNKESLLQNDIRIRVDLNLQRQANEIASKERDEEQERIDKIMDVGFNPEILADEPVSEAQYQNPQLNFFTSQKWEEHPGLRTPKIEIDPRSQAEIEQRLQQFGNALEQNQAINIQNNFAKQNQANQNTNVIKIPGVHWSDLK
ncbi:hypothetical protein SCLARK_00295 [Spiroplasma clarkii]|uniref:Uncharacterized protein n=1 Tax=Spiroplasma clarkii TaxID=2139 RepID=A0A1Y0KZ71_9MOLU|nr:hypothetical protein [Spiroplasma clarkii]ARU91052.1 hypothetical protein SCLARK_00295 [Spiroplasma clarkii]ATX70487.1 hypothetical protein SCLAR_v1c01560 [Spiroplasma clarkii]